MGKVFGDDAASRLLLLRDLIAVSVIVLLEMTAIILGRSCGAGDLDLGAAKLCVIKKQGGFCGSFFLEGDGCFLGLPSRLDLEAGDLATVVKD